MANTFDLVGSPLGLFTLKSRPTRDGMSTFNGGKSRNINVIAYNTGKKQATNLKNKSGNTINSPVSLFSGGTLPNFWPNIKTAGTDLDPTGSTGSYSGFSRNDLHNNDVYDTSLLNIIEKLSFSKMAALRPQDFAYLKNVGVFPNNRLMIARRFLSPVKDNIMGKGGTSPKSILISWKPEGEDFLSIDFGEEWMDAEADFTNVLNKLGEDFGIGGMGSGAGKAINVLPLPGFTEGLQRGVLEYMGILEPGQANAALPSGNPNIIKVAKRRKTIGYGQSGSGLKCSVNIKMTVEYEQKFISGIDPTIAWMDIINNILVFGTSKSSNYGISSKFRQKIDQWTNNPSTIITDIIQGIRQGIEKVVSEIKEIVKEAKEALDRQGNNNQDTTKKKDLIDKAEKVVTDLVNKSLDSISKAIQKYRVELMGVANNLSGAPSTPWHITIGNPLRPVFCSGDMYISDNVKLTLGPTLAFNDLPSNIKVEFTLTNARPWGLQEILAKFNTGHLRTVNIQKDYLELENQLPGNVYTDNSIIESDKPLESSGQSSSSQGSNTGTVSVPQTKENAE
jgi:hypothetical protein